MQRIIKKLFYVLIVVSQLASICFIPLVKAENSQETENTTSKTETPLKEPATSSFNITRYLTAPGQEQKYFQDQNGQPTTNPIANVIVQAINFLVMVIGSFSLLTVVAGGFILLISNGDENLVNKGKDMIKYSLIGLVIALSAYIIVAYVRSIFYELPGK